MMETIKVEGKRGTVGQITHGWMTGSAAGWYSVAYGGHGTPTITSLKKAPAPEEIARELARLTRSIQETAATFGR